MPIVGWAIVALFAIIIGVLIVKKNKELKAEYALDAKKKQASRV